MVDMVVRKMKDKCLFTAATVEVCPMCPLSTVALIDLICEWHDMWTFYGAIKKGNILDWGDW